MSKILKDLYLGGKAEAKDKKLLQDLKIKYILNCTPSRNLDPETGCPCFFEKEKSFKYCRIPVFDNKGEDILGHMNTAFQFIEEGKHYGGVFVHCHKGISRSSSFVIGYLMKYNEMTLHEALSYVQSIRPIVAPNESFLGQLKQYDVTLQKERQMMDEKKNKDNQANQSGIRIGDRDFGVMSMPSVMPSAECCIEISTGPSLPPHLPQSSSSSSASSIEIITPSISNDDDANVDGKSDCIYQETSSLIEEAEGKHIPIVSTTKVSSAAAISGVIFPSSLSFSSSFLSVSDNMHSIDNINGSITAVIEENNNQVDNKEKEPLIKRSRIE